MATSRSNVFNSTGSITASGDARIHVGNSHRHLHIHSEAVREETEQLRISFLQRLRACPYEERKNRNPQRAEGTCGWFTRHTRFQNWRRQRSALLWVSADPGCGKSVLSRYLIDAVLPVSDDRIVCYFFFKDDFEDQRTLSIALRCILHQLFRQEPSLLSSEVLKHRCAREIVCILDALDECSDSKQLIEALTATFVGGQGTHRLKVIATSRPYRIIRSDFATLEGVQPTIHLSGESKEEANQISEEISVVIQQHIAQLTKLRQLSSTQAESLRAAMAASENRTYLWVYLVFADLDKASLLNQYALQEAIEALPQELDEAYDGILSKSENPAQVLTVLQIIVAAERPLHLREMAVALALGGKEYHAYQELEADVSDATQLQQEIRDLCGLFIVVVDERLFLLHQTAREFLVRPSSWTVQRLKWRHAVDLSLAHAVLADLCMRYLLLQPASTLGPKVRGIHITGEPLQDSVFLGYAALHWPEHYRHGATQASNELDSMAHTLCVQQESWLGVHTSNCAVDRHDDKPITPLEVAAYFGLHPLIHLIVPPLGSGRRVNWWDVGRALALASRHGHAAFIETILKSHISETQAKARTFHSTEMLDRISLFKGRALIRATTHGHHHIVEMLLEAGADANFIENNSFLSYLTGRAKATPLSTAARRGDDRIVRLLIQYGANSGIESSGDTALLRATKQGHHDAVELLLNHDAEIDAVDPDRRTALLCAVEAEAQAIVYLLVTRNAN
ncbi:ankyrin repeat-containing domain protein, partial [Microdochium trichocladiopsis]